MPQGLRSTRPGFSVVQAEAVKEQLSSLSNRPIEIFSTKHGIVKLSITQDEFIAAAKSIFDQSIWCVEEALSLSHLGPDDIAGVFMAGGSSNIPELKRRLQDLFGFEPVRRNPSQAIALGAAIFAGTLYAMALGAPRWLGAITPIGGSLLIAGWVALAWTARRES